VGNLLTRYVKALILSLVDNGKPWLPERRAEGGHWQHAPALAKTQRVWWTRQRWYHPHPCQHTSTPWLCFPPRSAIAFQQIISISSWQQPDTKAQVRGSGVLLTFPTAGQTEPAARGGRTKAVCRPERWPRRATATCCSTTKAPRPWPACRGDEKGSEIIMSLTTTALFREPSQLLGKKEKKKEEKKKERKTPLG